MKNQKIITLCLGAVCLLLAALLLWNGGSGGIEKFFSQGESISEMNRSSVISSQREKRMRLDKQRKECAAAIQAAYNRFLNAPKTTHAEVDKAEVALVSALALCAETDLNEVHRWLVDMELTNRLPKERKWLSEVLKELAKKQPRKALEFGLSLN